MVTYKVRVNRPCRLFMDDEEITLLDESKIAKFDFKEGEYLRKVVAVDNDEIMDESEIVLSGSSKLDIINLDTSGLDEAKRLILSKNFVVRIGDLLYRPDRTREGLEVTHSTKDNLCYSLKNVTVPKEVYYKGYILRVFGIGDRAFYFGKELVSVTLPNSIKYIGNSAFYGCYHLTKINIPSTITDIGASSFYKTRIQTISIPEGVNKLREKAFYGCEELYKVYIPSSVTSIEKHCFDSCKSLAIINIPEKLLEINEAAFAFCESLKIIGIPITSKLKHIHRNAFRSCTKIESIYIPQFVEYIDSTAFYECLSIASIIVAKNNSIYDSRNNCNAIILTQENQLILGCKNTIIPNGIRNIGAYAFYKCGITEVLLPDSIERISMCAFDASRLKSIEIPEGTKYLERSAFEGCKELLSVKISSSVLEIGDSAFSNSSHINTFIVDERNSIFDSRNNCNAIIETASDTILYACQNTFIPPTVLCIGREAYWGCDELETIFIPRNIKTIEGIPFNREKLSSIIVDDANPYFDSRNNCNAIIDSRTDCLLIGCQNTVIPSTIKSIGKGAFSNVGNVETLTIPKNIEEIKDNAFVCCSIKRIIIDEGLKKIGDDVFAYSGVEFISFPSTVEEIGYNIFEETDELKTVSVPKSVYKKFSIFEDWFGADSDELVIR